MAEAVCCRGRSERKQKVGNAGRKQVVIAQSGPFLEEESLSQLHPRDGQGLWV
jgi:hypothetical protein